jgi:hypothetical protein
MPTGYEDYVRYQWTNPRLALARAMEHEIGLSEMASGARTQADGVLYDPATLAPLMDRVRVDIQRLVGVVHGIGKPRMQPTRRIDPGPNVGVTDFNSAAGA